MKERFQRAGLHPHVMRGDGSRPGLGDHEDDPSSEWWRNFKEHIKGFENEYDAWRIGARRLLGEVAVKCSDLIADPKAIILLDRSQLSRIQMTMKEGLEPTFENMYRNVGNDTIEDSNIRLLSPDLIIYLHVPTNVLLKRLTTDDPKYEFRHNNILQSANYYEEAFANLKKQNNEVVRINGDQDIQTIEKTVANVIMDKNIFDSKGFMND